MWSRATSAEQIPGIGMLRDRRLTVRQPGPSPYFAFASVANSINSSAETVHTSHTSDIHIPGLYDVAHVACRLGAVSSA